MLDKSLRYCLFAFLALTGVASSQQNYILPYGKTPETPAEFWAAVKYEVELGNHNRAAVMTKNLWEKLAALPEADQTKLLLGFYDADGLSAFLQLGTISELHKVTAKEAGSD